MSEKSKPRQYAVPGKNSSMKGNNIRGMHMSHHCNFACLAAGEGLEPPSYLFRILDYTNRWICLLNYPALMGRILSPVLINV